MFLDSCPEAFPGKVIFKVRIGVIPAVGQVIMRPGDVNPAFGVLGDDGIYPGQAAVDIPGKGDVPVMLPVGADYGVISPGDLADFKILFHFAIL